MEGSSDRRLYDTSVEKEFKSYVYLLSAARNALQNSKRTELEGAFYDQMTSMLFSALALEALLNHIGMRYVRGWDHIEVKLSPKQKANFLSEQYGESIDWGISPFQTIGQLLSYRDALVHAKTETIVDESPQLLESDEKPRVPLGKWEKFVGDEDATLFHDETVKGMKQLLRMVGLPETDIFMGGLTSSRKGAPIEEEPEKDCRGDL